MARLPRTSQGVGEEPLLLAGAMSHQACSRGTELRTQGGAGAVGGKLGFRAGAEAADPSSVSPAGLGLHLRPQLLPLCPGHGLRPAAAQGQQEGWKRGAPRQAALLHPLLCLYLTVHPRLQAPALPHPRPGERPPSFPTWRNAPPQILRSLQGCGKHPTECLLENPLLRFLLGTKHHAGKKRTFSLLLGRGPDEWVCLQNPGASVCPPRLFAQSQPQGGLPPPKSRVLPTPSVFPWKQGFPPLTYALRLSVPGPAGPLCPRPRPACPLASLQPGP